MGKSVQVNVGYTFVLLPDRRGHNAGDIVALTDVEYAGLEPATTQAITLLGNVADPVRTYPVFDLTSVSVALATKASTDDGRFTDVRVPTDASVTGGNAGAGVKLAAGTITDANVAAANKDGAIGLASMRTLGPGATQAAPGDDARFTDMAVPSDGSVTGGPAGAGVKIAATTITDDNVAAANKDGAAGTPSMRTLGAGATQAAGGTDARLSDTRTPTDASVTTAKIAGGGLATSAITGTAVVDADSRLTDARVPTDGSVTGGTAGGGVKIAASTITDVNVAAANKDGTAGTASMRTLGTGAAQATSGTDARLSDTRVPTDASVTGGAAGAGVKLAASTITDDNVAAANKDGAAGTASMRTLGAGAAQAASGTDARLSDTRTPTDASVTTAKIAGGGLATSAITGTAVITTDGRLSRKTVRSSSSASAATLTPEVSAYDVFRLTAQAAALNIANHVGTGADAPTDGETIRIAITDDGTARALTYGTNYVAKGGYALPTTTVISKRLELGFEWASDLGKYVLLAVAQEV